MNYKNIDYKVVEERVLEVLEENGVKDITGIDEVFISNLERAPLIYIGIVFNFCERYGCSIDYVLGRTDRYWL